MSHTPTNTPSDLVSLSQLELTEVASNIFLAKHPYTKNPQPYLDRASEGLTRLEALLRVLSIKVSKVGLDTRV